jgi:hypothetical protein
MSALHGGHSIDRVGAPDPFDPASLRLSQDPLATSMREDCRLDTAIIDLRDDREADRLPYREIWARPAICAGRRAEEQRARRRGLRRG